MVGKPATVSPWLLERPASSSESWEPFRSWAKGTTLSRLLKSTKVAVKLSIFYFILYSLEEVKYMFLFAFRYWCCTSLVTLLGVSMSQKLEAPLSLSDCLCQICMEIFVEPVTLPCNHTLCNSCFQLTVEKASLCCPFCRRRVSSWARYNARRNTLINWEFWEKIQKNYPKECERRINGQDLEEESK